MSKKSLLNALSRSWLETDGSIYSRHLGVHKYLCSMAFGRHPLTKRSARGRKTRRRFPSLGSNMSKFLLITAASLILIGLIGFAHHYVDLRRPIAKSISTDSPDETRHVDDDAEKNPDAF